MIAGQAVFGVRWSKTAMGMALTVPDEGHEHGGQQSEYREWDDSEKYEPQAEDDSWKDEDEDDTYRSSSKHYPSPDWEHSSSSEPRGRPW